MPASAIHHTATTDKPWDGPAAVAAMPNDEATLTYCHAWHSANPGDVKADYKFPHHYTKGGPANLAACRAGVGGRLAQAQIDNKEGVAAHLRAHMADAQ